MNALFGLFAGPFCYLCFVYACHILLSVPSSLLATLERTDLLALLYVIFSRAFYRFPIWFLGSGVAFELSIPDHCLLLY